MPSETDPLLSKAPQTPSHAADTPADSNRRDPYNGVSDVESSSEKPRAVSMAAIFPPLALGIFLMALDTTIVVSTYAAIGSEMNSLQNMSWISTAYLLTSTSFQPLYGKMSDIFGRKSILIGAYSIFGLGSVLCGLAQNIEQLTAARALAGIGGGGMTTIGSIILSDLVPLRERGTWQGFVNLAFAVGQSLGGPVGGLFADSIGWRWAFVLQGPLTLLALLAVSISLHLPQKETGAFIAKLKKIDFLGSLSLVAALLLLLLSFDRGATVSWNDRVFIATLCASAAVFGIFILIELYVAPEPLMPPRILSNRSLITAYMANFFMTATGLAVTFNLPLYLQVVQGMSAAHAGLYIIPSTLGGVSGSLSGGAFIQRTGKYYYATVSLFVLSLVSSVVLAASTGWAFQSNAVMAVAFGTMLFGFGFGITSLLIAIIAIAGEEDQAMATAGSYLFRSLGSVLGVAIGSAVVQSTLRRTLQSSLPRNDIDEIMRKARESLDSIKYLDPATQDIVRQSYAHAVHVSWIFVIGCAAGIVLFSSMVKEKPLPKKK